MKNILFLLLSSCCIILVSCQKDTVESSIQPIIEPKIEPTIEPTVPPNIQSSIVGIYTGSTSLHSVYTTEVWTSQSTYHLQTKDESSVIQRDTLIIQAVGQDSFLLKGRVGIYLQYGPYKFSCNGSQASCTLFFNA